MMWVLLAFASLIAWPAAELIAWLLRDYREWEWTQ